MSGTFPAGLLAGTEPGMNPVVTKQAAQLLAEYSADHRNPLNQRLHSVCVPLIFLAVIGLLWSLPRPAWLDGAPSWVNAGTLTLAGVTLYYLRLAPRLGLGMLPAAILMTLILGFAAGLPAPLALTALATFVLGWTGQFIGHFVEGRRPSFFRDLRFLLIGPLWVLAKLYAALGIRA